MGQEETTLVEWRPRYSLLVLVNGTPLRGVARFSSKLEVEIFVSQLRERGLMIVDRSWLSGREGGEEVLIVEAFPIEEEYRQVEGGNEEYKSRGLEEGNGG